MNGTAGAKPIGIHLEGPYLSKEYSGAQPAEYLKNPDISELESLYDISSGLIKLITLAPELNGAAGFIRYAVSKGIIISIGHSSATYNCCIEAISEGAKSVTHTLNAMRAFHQHEPSILGAAVLSDIYCEIICDGRHLHPQTVEFLIKIKGVDKVILVTDSLMAAGLPDGVYEGFTTIIVENGDAKLLNGVRAGSSLKAIDAVKNVIQFSGVDLNKAVSMITKNPAKLLGIDKEKGMIREGYDADIVLFDNKFEVKMTIVEGRIVYTRL